MDRVHYSAIVESRSLYPSDCASTSQTKLSHALYIRVHDYKMWLTSKGYFWKLCWLELKIDLTCGTETKQMERNERQAGVGGHYFSLQFLLLSLKTLINRYFGNLIW